jgi:hypothetical protein
MNMTHEVNLTMKMEGSDEDIKIICSVGDNEWKYLDKFTQYAEDLLKTDWVKNGMYSKLNLNLIIGEPVHVKTELPLWNDVIVFLHRIRPFLLQNEDTNFNRIANFLYKNIENSHIRSFIAEQRKIYSGQMTQEFIKISSNDVIINSEKVLMDWLNAYEYHRDQDKKTSIDDLHRMIPLEASKVLFLQMLSDKAGAIYNLTGFIRVFLGKQKNYNLKFNININ